MKSTGLFGKNSGRVGGVVYSTYRGEQIVRAYQPKVANPNTMGQIAQRAKFKLVSQVGSSLGREIALSYVPSVAKESPRNAFVKAMLKKTTYNKDNRVAELPIEEIELTNSRENVIAQLTTTTDQITGILSPNLSAEAKVRIVYIGYNQGGEITLIGGLEQNVQFDENENTYVFRVNVPELQGYTNVRALIYVYEPDKSAGTTYEDYEVLNENATLSDIVRVFRGRLNFYQTENVLIPRNV